MKKPAAQLILSLIAMAMISSLQYSWNLFVEPMREARGWELPGIQFAFFLFALFQTFVQPLDGWFIDRLGPRGFITVAGILCGVGWSAMGYATSLPQLYFFYVLAGIGAAFVYSGSIGSALKWYPSRRGFASGVIAAGFGGGTALFTLIISYLIRQQGYSAAFLFTGVIQGAVITGVAQFLRHPGPDFAPPRPVASAVVSKSRRNTENLSTPEMLGTPHFYVLYVMFVAMAAGGLFVTTNQGSIVKSWGMTTVVLTTINFINPLANAASRIFWGWFSDRLGREMTMVVAFLLQAGCLLSVVMFGQRSPTLFVITIALTFFTWGEVFSLFPSTSGDYFGSKFATANYGLLYTAKGVASFIGPLGAFLYGQYGSWTIVFYGSAVLALLACVMAFALRSVALPKRAVARAVALG
ncbi:MAG TPA: oxalate/formate MFS antiporter [Terriglobia bacterium]|nr:oxalate/formate MFS antiporter [Terriglobia bacterium]